MAPWPTNEISQPSVPRHDAVIPALEYSAKARNMRFSRPSWSWRATRTILNVQLRLDSHLDPVFLQATQLAPAQPVVPRPRRSPVASSSLLPQRKMRRRPHAGVLSGTRPARWTSSPAPDYPRPESICEPAPLESPQTSDDEGRAAPPFVRCLN